MLFNTLLVIVLSVSGVLSHGESEWGVTYTPQRICALKGSSVNMSCTYSYPTSGPVQKTLWFIQWKAAQEPEDLSQDPEYSGRVEYLGNNNSDCTFRINQLRESDSAIYRFRFLTYSQHGKYTGQPGVSLTVTGLQVKVTENEAQSVTLTCSSTCTLSGRRTFTWYKNREVVTNQNEYSLNVASTGDTDLYSCATGGVSSPAVNVKCVKVEMKSETRSEGEWVTLTCEITCTDLTGRQTIIWYRNGESLQYSEQKYQQDDYLQFIATSGDAGSYSCAVRGHENLLSPAVNLYPPKSVSVSVSPSREIKEGSSVTLTCSSDANPPVQILKWYKNDRAVSSLSESKERYIINKINSWKAGDYYCEAGNGIGTDRSPNIRLDVQYSPKSVSVSVSPSGEIVEGSSVNLTCSSYANPPVHIYTWYKKTGFPFSRRGSEQSYTINKIKSGDAGEYYCEAQNGIGINESPPKRLDVQYPPKSVSVSVSPSGEIVEGSSVTLNCSSDANPPVQNYTWFKKNDTGVWQAGSGLSLNFSNFTSWNRGQYYCEARNKHGRQNSTAVSINIEGGQSRIAAAAVGVAAILALVFLGVVCLRRRKSTNETEGDRHGNKSPIFGNVSGMAMSHTGTQGTDRDDGEVPLYASVQPANTRNKDELLPSTVQKPLPQCEEGVQYASIQFRPSSAAPRSPAPSVKEDCVLYSTLRKLDM